MEPIYETAADRQRERLVVNRLKKLAPTREFIENPKLYVTDYHVIETTNNRTNYIGDIEIKWFNHDSSRAAWFNYNKLCSIALLSAWREHAGIYHRVVMRFDDGLLIIPARRLMALQPEVKTRRDTNETDLVVVIRAGDYSDCWLNEVILDEGR